MRTSSTSKTKKIRQIIKNRIEKGSRALNFGINPHSKGLTFSREKCFFLPKIIPIKNTRLTSIAIKNLIKDTKNIS